MSMRGWRCKEDGDASDAELMFLILDFVRTHERRVFESQFSLFHGKEVHSTLHKFIATDYLQKVEKGRRPFYTITSILVILNSFSGFSQGIPGSTQVTIIRSYCRMILLIDFFVNRKCFLVILNSLLDLPYITKNPAKFKKRTEIDSSILDKYELPECEYTDLFGKGGLEWLRTMLPLLDPEDQYIIHP